MDDALRRFGAAVNALFDELDWPLLEASACEGDGSGFYDDELRERILDTGLLLADDIATALGRARGQSLYLGAEIAELPVILAESVVLGRRVEWRNIDGPSVRELVRALDVVSARLCVALPRPQNGGLERIEAASCDHLWMASVLTDPDSFPALHDALYERAGSALATARGDLADDRRRATDLIDAWLDCASHRCVVTTTDEERTLVEPRVMQRGWRIEFTGAGRLSSIVGDRIRIGTLRRGP